MLFVFRGFFFNNAHAWDNVLVLQLRAAPFARRWFKLRTLSVCGFVAVLSLRYLRCQGTSANSIGQKLRTLAFVISRKRCWTL